MRRFCFAKDILDRPNHRSSHSQPTALMGGVGFISAIWVAILWVGLGSFSFQILVALGLATVMGIVGLIDDVIQLSSKIRFLAQGILSGIAVYFGFILTEIIFPGVVLPLGWFTVPLTIIFLMAFTNIYNFMDGIDGYAGSQGVIALTGMIIFWCSKCALTGSFGRVLDLSERGLSPQFLGILLAALLGFLVWNWPKAKIFMGDVGSAFLGFLFACLLLLADPSFPLLYGLMLFGVFVADATVTLIIRFIKKENVLEAHREHFYQKLIRSGFSHLKVVLLDGVHMIFLIAALSLHPKTVGGDYLVLAVVILSFVVKYLWIQRNFDAQCKH